MAFKRTKLDDGVGSRRTFSTSQEWYAGDLSGLKSGFNDWIPSCPIYKGNLTTAVQDKWVLESVTDKLDVMITRTWDNDYYCNICPASIL